MEIQRGIVAERPFARLVYNVSRQRFTGDLSLEISGHEYRTSWEDGRVVAAFSPATSDSLARVAMSARVVTSSSVGRYLDHLKSNPKADELETLATIAGLRGEQILMLKQRLLAQRAIRQFALPGATFALNNARSMSADPHVPPLDARWLVFHGIRSHYQVTRLEREMSPVFGTRFRVASDVGVAIASFGFNDQEMAAVRRLGHPMSVDELVAASPELDRSTVLTIVYALVATDCLEASSKTSEKSNPLTEPAARRISAAEIAEMQRGRARTAPPPRNASPTKPPAPRRPRTTTRNRREARLSAPPTTSGPKRRARASAAFSRRHEVTTGTNLRPPTRIGPGEVKKLISEKAKLLDEHADHFRLLGISFNANEGEIRSAYFDLAKRLHPDRLHALHLTSLSQQAQRVFAAINLAFSVLSDRKQIASYRMSLESSLGAQQLTEADAEQIAAAIFAAEDAFRLGQMALRRNHLSEAVESFAKAVELNPEEGEHHAFLAWARFCEASDKTRVAEDVNHGFAKAVEISPNNPTTHLLRGHFARQSGDRVRAERYYRRVLSLDPQSSEAQMNLRLLASR